MSGLSFDGAMTSGHATYPPSIIKSSQSKVYVVGIPALVDGDQMVPHTNTVKPYDTHGGQAQATTSKIYITGKKAVQMADPVSCGDTVAQASPKVFIK